MFCAVTDTNIAQRIEGARQHVMFAAPAMTGVVAEALLRASERLDEQMVTVFVDVDDDAYRIGYGDIDGARQLAALSRVARVIKQAGLRIGLLVADGALWIWSPSPLSVERERNTEEPNGVLISLPSGSTTDARTLLGPGDSTQEVTITPSAAIVDPIEVERIITQLEESPPAPFDLSRVTRVFACKYQFVEIELKGAEWTNRKIQLSSVLVNSDVPDELGDLLQTTFQPFKELADESLTVPALICGDLAYRADRSQILTQMTQRDLRRAFDEIRERYVKRVGRFGWIISRSDKDTFVRKIGAFQHVLQHWVDAFRVRAKRDEDELVDQLAKLIMERVKRSSRLSGYEEKAVKVQVRAGLQRLRVSDPCVELIFKNIAPESAADGEFLRTLKSVLPLAEMEGWYKVFNAAQEDPTRLG